MLSKLTRLVLVTSLVAFVAWGMGTQTYASTVERSNWVPNVGERNFDEDEQPLGDMWTFICPAGGKFKLSVDTKDDTDVGRADIDPIVVVIDGNGNFVASGDDEVDCTYEPICGFACPAVESKCGQGIMHSIVVRDFGTASQNPDVSCQEGGGYELDLKVTDGRGNRVPEVDVKLGGGALRTVPQWALEEGKAPVGPALDDENVPNPNEMSSDK